jgi:AcrR family transcriptional regulator
MGIPERRERQKAELRDQILTAASRIIAEDGFDALTMRKIADAIEYSPATIYLYFASRDEIALELVRNGFVALERAMVDAHRVSDPLQRIRELGRAYLAFAVREPQTYKLIFMEDERFAAPLMQALKDDPDNAGDTAFGYLIAAVAELVERGIFRPIDPQLGASLLWAALHGMAALNLTCTGYPFESGILEPGETMLDVLERGLLAENHLGT